MGFFNLLKITQANRLLTCAGGFAESCGVLQVQRLTIVSTSAKFLVPLQSTIEQKRNTNFYRKHTAEKLWKSVTTVSNPGKKRGRGRGRNRVLSKDLNRGQMIGQGKVNVVWPGLNAPIFRGRELVKQETLPEQPDRDAKLIELRNKMGVFRSIKLPPLERGWSGNWLPGRRIGPPDPIGEETFEGFDSVVLECKTVSTMTGNLGRKFSYSIFVVTGNGDGLGGFALGRAPSLPAALRKAKNRAGQKLMRVERHENHTVLHDFHANFGKSRINVHKAPKGFGLVCHRAIKSICEVIGIKDLHAKKEACARKTVQNLTKAFFLGLLRQKSYQEMSDETKLLLVERNPDRLGFPRLLAEPSEPIPDEKIGHVPDFQSYCFGGRVEHVKKKDSQWYKKLPGWQTHLKRTHPFRNMPNVRIRMLVDHGELRSHLTDKYPECVSPNVAKRRPKQES